MENISSLKESLTNKESKDIIEIYINGIRQNVSINPIFNEEKQSVFFSDIYIGKKKEIYGKIKKVSVLSKYEREEGIIALYYSGKLKISELVLLKEKGILYLVGTDNFFCDLFSTCKVPTLLWDEYHKIDCLFNESDITDIKLIFDLTMFESIKVNEYSSIIYDKMLDETKLANRINTSLYQILSLSSCLKPNKFDVYYFKSIEQLHIFTGMQTTFAYKDKIIFLTYSDLHNNTEIHEIFHILLYGIGDPPFLLKEGLPSLGYELCKPQKKYNRYVCNVFMRNRILKNLPYKTIDQLIDFVVSDRKYNGEDYYTAASFLLWIVFEKGLDTVLDCYRLLKRENTSKQNQCILENIVGEKYDSMILRWKERITS